MCIIEEVLSDTEILLEVDGDLKKMRCDARSLTTGDVVDIENGKVLRNDKATLERKERISKKYKLLK